MTDHTPAFDAGVAAYHEGLAMARNPYCPAREADNRDAWAAGYLHADYHATPKTEPTIERELTLIEVGGSGDA